MLSRRDVVIAGMAFGIGSAKASKGPYPVTREDSEWRRLLSAAEYGVLRESGTEAAYSSPLDREKRAGLYGCAGCEQALFSSRAKFDSGTGWPSFYAALPAATGTSRDRSYGMVRTGVHCSRCGGHLGHVFDDGPAPTGKRFCMNGVALRFRAGATS